MSRRHLAAFATVVVVSALVAIPAAAQNQSQAAAEPAAWTMPRLPDGQPDLQGYWTTQTFTPLERPERLADQEFLSEEEAALLQEQLTAEGVDPLRRDAVAIEDPDEREAALYQENRDASYVHYDNQVWLRTPVPKGLSTRRTSLITYPPNGRIPPMTPEGAARVEADAAMAQVFDGYETRPLMERCVVWTHEGPPVLPPAYNDIHQIFQTPDHFVLFTELATNPPRIMAPRRGPGRSRRDSPVRRRLARPLGGRHAGRRDRPVHRPAELPGLEPAPARRGAVHPHRRGHHPLRVHDHRPDHLDQPVERRSADGPHRGADVRVRLPRGQPRHPAHSRDQPQSRAAGGRGGVGGRLAVGACARWPGPGFASAPAGGTTRAGPGPGTACSIRRAGAVIGRRGSTSWPATPSTSTPSR